jgi:hypothetical protein
MLFLITAMAWPRLLIIDISLHYFISLLIEPGLPFHFPIVGPKKLAGHDRSNGETHLL